MSGHTPLGSAEAAVGSDPLPRDAVPTGPMPPRVAVAIAPRSVSRTAFGVVAVLVAAGLLVQWVKFGLGYPTVLGLGSLFDPTREQNIPSLLRGPVGAAPIGLSRPSQPLTPVTATRAHTVGVMPTVPPLLPCSS